MNKSIENLKKLKSFHNGSYGADIDKAVKALEQQKTGYWIGQKQIGFGEWKECIVPLKDGFVAGSCSCSECGEWLTASDEYLCYGNYCPNCGARMVELQESEVE